MIRAPALAFAAALVVSGCAAMPEAADGIAIVADSRPAQLTHQMRIQAYPVAEADRSAALAAGALGVAASLACGVAMPACINVLPALMARATLGPLPEMPVSDAHREAQLERLRAGLAIRVGSRLARQVGEEAAPRWRIAGVPASATLVTRIDSIALEDRGPRALHVTLVGSAQLRRGEPGQGLDDKAVGFMTRGWVEPGDAPADDELIERDVDRLLHDLAVDIVREVSRNRHAWPYLK